MALQKLLGSDKLVSKTGEVNTSSIEGKTLLIYFSAHWCPPCRAFTPKLATFYQKLKVVQGRDDFEIVFASSDQTEKEFNDYFKDAHGDWLALPYANRDAKEALSKHFKVEGIPTLAVVDSTGAVITTDGTDFVGDEDPEGKKFPTGWKARGLYEILADASMTSKDGTPLTASDLQKKDAFALYFSAHWCPPCRGFTPKLAATYKKMQQAAGGSLGDKMEIVFVSSDREKEAYTDYWGEMPWAAMAFQDGAVAELKKLCEVSGIPSLATFKGSDGSIINIKAKAVAAGDTEGTDFPWAKKPMPPCSAFTPRDDVFEAINEEICVVLACAVPGREKGCCPSPGCKLKSFTTPSDGYGCDVCEEGEFAKGTTMWGCREHNFDACSSCHSAELASTDEVTVFDATKDDAVKAEFTKAANKFHADAKANGEEPKVLFFIVDTPDGNGLYGKVLNAVDEEKPKVGGTPTVLAINFTNDRAKSTLSGAITTQSVCDHAAAFKKAQE